MIDLCSSEDDSDESEASGDEILVLSPIKPRISECSKKKHRGSSISDDPLEIVKRIIPHVTESDDYHDVAERNVPVLARPLQGLTVTQLFTLMIGTMPADRICHKKPTAVTYSGVFVIDLSCIRCIDDLRADDNGVCVNFETSPSCVLSTDDQLQNLVRFCTNPGSACILGIDPTFNMGKFYVTMTTFTYTHVIRKTTNISPTMFGPIFVHTEKSYESSFLLC